MHNRLFIITVLFICVNEEIPHIFRKKASHRKNFGVKYLSADVILFPHGVNKISVEKNAIVDYLRHKRPKSYKSLLLTL